NVPPLVGPDDGSMLEMLCPKAEEARKKSRKSFFIQASLNHELLGFEFVGHGCAVPNPYSDLDAGVRHDAVVPYTIQFGDSRASVIVHSRSELCRPASGVRSARIARRARDGTTHPSPGARPAW